MAAPQGIMNVRGQRVQKFRRLWLADEEEILLVCLRELVATGWKSDNGFRAGYINRLEDLMRVHFPTANVRANPHIVSKLTAWKKNYGSLSGILSRSGVGFNLHGDYIIDCDAEQWEQIFNVDANAKNTRGKAWPLYEKWAEVFGKDRATGGNAEDVLEAVNVSSSMITCTELKIQTTKSLLYWRKFHRLKKLKTAKPPQTDVLLGLHELKNEGRLLKTWTRICAIC